MEMEKKLLLTSGLLATIVVGALSYVHVSKVAASPSQTQQATVPFTELMHGDQSEVKDRVNYLITSAAELAALWKLVHATGTPPAVDFTKDAVIAVFAGEKPTTGYEIAVASVVDGKERLVSVSLKRPGVGCMEGQVITSPYELGVVPATSLPLTHEDTVTIFDCAH